LSSLKPFFYGQDRIHRGEDHVRNTVSPIRRRFLATLAATGAFSLLSVHLAAAADTLPSQPSKQRVSPIGTTENAVTRPFHINISDEALIDLRSKIGRRAYSS
jgi:hypothetical protein